MALTWSNFPVKHLIVPYLDLEARCNLRVCSKNDLELVDSSKFVPEKIGLMDIPGNLDREKSIIRLDIDSFTIWFIGKNNKTRIERAWNGEIMEMAETKNENRAEVCRRFINRFLKNGTFESQQLDLIEPPFQPDEHWKIKTSNLQLATSLMLVNECLNWLSKVAPGTKLKKLTIENGREMNGIADLPLIYDVTEVLDLKTRTDLNDENLERIKAKSLRFEANGLTPEGVKKALERFFLQSNPDSDFLCWLNFPDNFDPTILIPEGVKFEKVEKVYDSVVILKLPNHRYLVYMNNCVRIF